MSARRDDVLRGWRDLSTESGRCWRRRLAQLIILHLDLWCRLLLSTVIHHVSLLACHGVIDRIYPGHARNWSYHGLHAMLKLLVVEAIGRCHCGLEILLLLAAHSTVQIHVSHLLLCNSKTEELLL